jgi:hypothetical protein
MGCAPDQALLDKWNKREGTVTAASGTFKASTSTKFACSEVIVLGSNLANLVVLLQLYCICVLLMRFTLTLCSPIALTSPHCDVVLYCHART